MKVAMNSALSTLPHPVSSTHVQSAAETILRTVKDGEFKLAALPEQFLTIRLVTGGAQRMFNPLMLLAAEANAVIALRMMKLMRGGKSARREANLMVSEKINAAFEATASLVAGASGDEIVHRYRQHVAKNAKRLSSRSRNRVLKRTRRRRK
jgi:hypothetical protein